jgi:IPT/TIG domain
VRTSKRHLVLCGALFIISGGCGGGSSGPPPTGSGTPPPTGPAPDFNIAIQPGSLWLIAGSAAQIQVTLTSVNGFSGSASLTAGSLPRGVTVSPALPQNISSSGVTLSIEAAANATAGNYTVALSAASGNLGHSANLALTLAVPQAGTIPGNRTNWVRLGSNPTAVYYDASRNHILASLPALNRVDVIDPSSGNLLLSIPVSVAGDEPNGVQLISSSSLSGTLDGKSLLVLGAGHVATIDLASGKLVQRQTVPMTIPIGRTIASPIAPTFLTAASGGHMIFGMWGDSSFYNWDGVGALASLHSISDLYSFDRNFDGSRVLIASGDTSGAYQLLDVASDTITLQGAYSNATIMTVRGNPVRNEWAIANSNGIDFRDANLNLIANVPATFIGSLTYWGMCYSADGKYLYFVYSPAELPFLITVDTSTHMIVGTAPATGTDLAYFTRNPPEWVVQPFAADSTGLVFGLGEKGLIIDDSTYQVDRTQATNSDYVILATPDSGPLNGSTAVEITTQTYSVQPDLWLGTKRALATLNPTGQVAALTPPSSTAGPVNIKLFPPDGYAHVMPQAFTYGSLVTSVRNSVCPDSGGCRVDIFGFGLFGSDSSQTSVTIGGNAAPVQSVHYFNSDQPYPYPLQYVTVTVPAGQSGRADITVKSASGQSTLPAGLLYASSLQSYPSSQTYNALLFDKSRNVLYASTNSQIVRFSLNTSDFLSPIVPPTLTGQTQFEGMSLTPDGSRLLIANKLDVSVAVIDPDNPSNAKAVSIPITGPNTGGPYFVAATSTGKALVSISGISGNWTGPLFLLDLTSLQAQSLTIPDVFTGDGPRLSPTTNGNSVLIRPYQGQIGIWNATTQQYTPAADNFAGEDLGSSAGDGNVFAIGLGFIGPDGISTIGLAVPDELGGFQSFFPYDGSLNDSGSLLFAPLGTQLFIFDTKHGDLLRSLVLPHQVNVWAKVIALDSSGEHVFLSDSQGLTILTLASVPLAIGSISPSIVPAGVGGVIQVRGSGFQPHSTVSIGGQSATVSFTDANTIQVTTPANPSGAAQMIIQNPGGETYMLDAAVVYQ